ncbi:hypothetical protein CTAYLR_005195 [Chrysophaeum taylorii]|uniref:Exostosin GT47 domain-containing protein n=1 Tax=Chrysophaeum taylorii TaxID=2483200 RepID=A0AAD7UPL4_9STRA|nr:hypothetical protein CTAYLR_005178 [Chrysophaeum taylorii]KAJ8614161.1 hypothetical protein CTAYLR_005195 [Chrysophaeum taylorii]
MVFGVLSAAATSPLVVPESVLDEAAERVKVYVYKERGKKPSLGEPSGRIYWQLEGRLVRGLPRTSKASEATHFWIPHALMAHWRPPSTEARARLESYYRRRLRPTLEKVLNKLPYFNKSRDAHLFAYAYDLGPVCEAEGSILDDPLFQQVVHGSRVVGYHARDAAFDDSLAASVPRFGRRPKLRFGARRSCWGARDVAVPQFNKFHARGFSDGTTEAARGEDGKWVARLVREAKRRKATFFFRGQIVTGRCSATVRFWLARYCATRPWCASDGDARSAVFAPAPGGWGCWSSRFYDAVDAVTIPVRLADGLVEPFARLLNYSAFVRTLETGGDRETLDSDGLAAAFDAMHAEATAWRRDCAAAASSSDDDLCLSNPLSRTMRALALARPFLGWDDRRHAGRNAFALFLADLYLRHNRSSSSLPMASRARQFL